MRILAQKVKTFFATWEQLCQQYAHSCHLHPCSFFASSICFWNHDEPPFSQYILRFFEFPVITSSFSGATVVSICKCRGTYFELDTTQCVVFNKDKLQKVNALILHMQLISCKKFDRGHQEISFSHFWLKMTQCVL